MEGPNSEKAYWHEAVAEMREQNQRLKELDGRLWWILLLMMIDLLWRVFTD